MAAHPNNFVVPLATDTGAGVCLMEMFYDVEAEAFRLTVILVRDEVSKKFTIPGGKRNHHEKIEDTARRECKEETANLFRFPKHMMNGQFAIRHNSFVSYFIMVQGPISTKHFYSNLKKLTANGAPHDYRETDKIVRVYMDDLIGSGVSTVKGDLTTTDTDGKTILIEGRDKAVIREALKAGFIDNLQPVEMNFNSNYDVAYQPKLRNTKCYWV